MNEAILRRLDILLHGGFERNLWVSKHFPWPSGLIGCAHPALNDQMPRRSTHGWQFFWPDMFYRNEAEIDIERLTGSISRSTGVFG